MYVWAVWVCSLMVEQRSPKPWIGVRFPTDLLFAGMMELADVTDSKSVGSDTVWVQVPLPAL